MNLRECTQLLKVKIDEAWDDPRSSRPVDEVFARIEATHAEAGAKGERG